MDDSKALTQGNIKDALTKIKETIELSDKKAEMLVLYGGSILDNIGSVDLTFSLRARIDIFEREYAKEIKNYQRRFPDSYRQNDNYKMLVKFLNKYSQKMEEINEEEEYDRTKRLIDMLP